MANESVTIKYGADATKAVQAADKIIKKQEEVIRLLKKESSESKRAGADHATTAKKTESGLGLIAARYLSIGAAAAAARQAVTALNEEANRGADTLRASMDRIKNLVQISETPQELAALRARAGAFSGATGLPMEPSEDIIFQLKSAGKLSQQGLFQKVQSFSNAGEIIKGVGTLQGGFGMKETGGDAQVINKLLAGAKNAANSNMQQVSAATTGAASLFANIGASDEDLIAGIAATETAAGGASEAATALGQFAAVAFKEGFAGDTFDDTYQNFLNMPQKKRDKLLQGRKEFAKGVQIFGTNRESFRRIRADVMAAEAATGTSQSLINQKVRVAAEDQFLGPLLEESRQTARLRNTTAEGPGLVGLEVATEKQRAQKASLDADVPGVLRVLENVALSIRGLLKSGGIFPNTDIEGGVGATAYNIYEGLTSNGQTVEGRSKNTEELDRLTNALNRNTEALNGSATMSRNGGIE